jgi:hypothetical protein
MSLLHPFYSVGGSVSFLLLCLTLSTYIPFPTSNRTLSIQGLLETHRPRYLLKVPCNGCVFSPRPWMPPIHLSISIRTSLSNPGSEFMQHPRDREERNGDETQKTRRPGHAYCAIPVLWYNLSVGFSFLSFDFPMSSPQALSGVWRFRVGAKGR